MEECHRNRFAGSSVEWQKRILKSYETGNANKKDHTRGHQHTATVQGSLTARDSAVLGARSRLMHAAGPGNMCTHALPSALS